MIFFAHLGLTYAAAAGLGKLPVSGKRVELNNKAELETLLDYRLVFLGSILPDLIDKPMIFLLSAETIHSGRVFAHTLLFVLLLAGTGLFFRKKHRIPWALILAGGSLVHLILDSMWKYMITLFWPVYDLLSSHVQGLGNSIAHALNSIFYQPFENVSVESLMAAISEPSVGIPELAGFLIIAYLLVKLISQKHLWLFIKTGRFD